MRLAGSMPLKCTCACMQGQRAVQQKRRELVASSRTLDCRELTGNGRAKEWLTDRPELKELAPSLHRAMPEGERPRNSTVYSATLHCLSGLECDPAPQSGHNAQPCRVCADVVCMHKHCHRANESPAVSVPACLSCHISIGPATGWQALTGDEGVQVQVHPGLALPLQLHRKSELEAVILRALPEFGASKRPAYSFVSVR